MKSFLKPLFSAGLSFCLFIGIVAPTPLWALEVPQSGIDYVNSQLYVSYTDAITGFVNEPGNFECFDTPLDINLETFSRNLSALGVNSESDLIDIIGGAAEGCFQKSGTYYLMFKLQDRAGNCGWYPSGSTNCLFAVGMAPIGATPPGTGIVGWAQGQADPNWYKFVVKPSSPSAEALQPGDVAVTPTPSSPVLTPPLLADGNEAYDVKITLRDRFGNKVTQINNPDHFDLRVITDLNPVGTIRGVDEIDGIFAPVDPETEIPHNKEQTRIFDGTNVITNLASSKFAEGLKIGDNQLKDLLNQENAITNVTVSQGVLSFTVTSKVPTVKLIDPADPEKGAGIYKQPIVFNPKTRPINNDGSVSTEPHIDVQGSVEPVKGEFSFRPVVEIKPDFVDPGTTDVTASPAVIWSKPVEDFLVIGNGVLEELKYLFWTPRQEYVIKKETDEEDGLGGKKPAVSFPDLWEYASKTRFNNAVDTARILFEAATGDVGSAPPANIGVGTMIQYVVSIAGTDTTLRHHSRGSADGDCSSVANFEVSPCYAFGGSASARFIGADIEGAVIADREKILIYQIAEGGQRIGQQTAFSGGLSNDRIQESLRTNINQAVRNPASTAVYAKTGTNHGVLMSQIIAGIAVNSHDVIIVQPGHDLIINTAEVPSGKRTIIVTNGNVYVENDMNYGNSNDSLGIIAYNTSFTRADGQAPATGHIIVNPSVKKMVGTYYADGSLLSLTSSQITDLKAATDLVDLSTKVNSLGYIVAGKDANQLLLEGIVLSKNTLGGALIDSGTYATPWHNNGTSNPEVARLYDLHFVRRYFEGGGGTCSVSPACDPNKNAFVIRLDNKATYPETAPPVFRDLPEISR